MHHCGTDASRHCRIAPGDWATDGNRRMNGSPPGRSALRLAMSGIAAGVLAGAAMNLYARIMATATNDHEAEGAAPGDNRTGRGMQPPQARAHAGDDAAVRAGDIAYRAVVRAKPADRARLWLGSAAHYGFSGAVGLCYALLVPHTPSLRTGFGTLYGTLVWAIADEGLVPALGLSRRATELSLGVHLYSLCGHWVYGSALDALMRRS